eukprot:SAG31_NODE_1317_length_8836_cov_3.151311_8_plen_138_part_00
MCLDSYLFLFTLFPLRLLSAILHALPRLVPIPYVRDRCFRSLRADERVDIVRGAFLFICTAGLLWFADISKAYHIIRGQATIKLYVVSTDAYVTTYSLIYMDAYHIDAYHIYAYHIYAYHFVEHRGDHAACDATQHR